MNCLAGAAGAPRGNASNFSLSTKGRAKDTSRAPERANPRPRHTAFLMPKEDNVLVIDGATYLKRAN
jgi:hypothetical protein